MMKEHVLLNVYTHQVKNDLLSILIQNKCAFMEVFGRDELTFRYNLIKEEVGLYIHELDENNYTQSLEDIRKMTDHHVRCIILIHQYSSHIIEDALALKVKDIIVLPIERVNLDKKLKSYITGVEREIKEKEEHIIGPTVKLDNQIVADAVNRATRGHYPLSFVLIEYKDIEGRMTFKRALTKLLRATDVVLEYGQGEWLIICPFTPKSYLVEVENKARSAHNKTSKGGQKQATVYLYGVTFPDDGDSFEVLERELKDGIHDSIIFSNLGGTLAEMDKEALRIKLKRDYQ